MVTETNRKIHAALNGLMAACELQGESGTETLFGLLYDAVGNVSDEWHIVDESHDEGLCYDVNCLLADAIEEALGHMDHDEPSPPRLTIVP
jgi:hypothetical protein